MIGGQQDLAQVGLSSAVRNRREQIALRVGGEALKRLAIAAIGGNRLRPRRRAARRRRRRPVVVRPLLLFVLGGPAELEDVVLRDPQVLDQLPQGMLRARGHFTAEPRRNPLHRAIEPDVRLLEIEQLHQLPTQGFVIDHRFTAGRPEGLHYFQTLKSSDPRIHRFQSTRMRSDLVMMNVLSVLKSRTSTAGFCGVIIVCSRSTGVETSTNGNAGCMMVSTGCDLMSAFFTSSL